LKKKKKKNKKNPSLFLFNFFLILESILLYSNKKYMKT